MTYKSKIFCGVLSVFVIVVSCKKEIPVTDEWQMIGEGLPSFLGVQTMQTIDGIILHLGTNEGVYNSIDGGKHWHKMPGPDFPAYCFAMTPDGVLFAGSYQCVLMLHQDGIWRVYRDSFWANVVTSAMVLNGYLITGSTGVYKMRMSDPLAPWINTGLPDNGTADAFEVKETVIYVGGNKGFYVSNDFGQSFVRRSLGLHDSIWIESLLINKNGRILAGTNAGVFFADQAILQWIPKNTGLPADAIIDKMAMNIDGKIFLTTLNRGIFLSKNGGESWIAINEGLLPGGYNSISAIAVTLTGQRVWIYADGFLFYRDF